MRAGGPPEAGVRVAKSFHRGTVGIGGDRRSECAAALAPSEVLHAHAMDGHARTHAALPFAFKAPAVVCHTPGMCPTL